MIAGKGFGQSEGCVAKWLLRLGSALFLCPMPYDTHRAIGDLCENCDFLIPDSGLHHTDEPRLFPIDQTAITIYYAGDPARRICDALWPRPTDHPTADVGAGGGKGARRQRVAGINLANSYWRIQFERSAEGVKR